MSKTYLVVIVIFIVLLILLGVNVFNRSSASVVPNTNQATETAGNVRTPASPTESTALITKTISLTDEGFSPSTLTISVGETVTFVNNSTQMMWVASDPHPIHNGYPGFDAKKGLAQGQSYTFTFDKVGTWGFHNHLDASQKGSINVN